MGVTLLVAASLIAATHQSFTSVLPVNRPQSVRFAPATFGECFGNSALIERMSGAHTYAGLVLH